MKRSIYFILTIITTILAGCSQADYLLYEDVARIQLADTTLVSYTFVYEPVSIIQDTVYIQVNTIGDVAGYDREVKLIQVPEYDYTFIRDEHTNEIIDTVKTERLDKAIPGVHYVALDDPSMKNLLVVKANTVKATIPVILLRNASLKDAAYRLRLQIAASADFDLGELKAREKVIVISDRLERFYSWRVDNTTATAYNTFGKYSVNKHQFMVDVLNVPIDEEWYQAILSIGATQHYKNYLSDALSVFNNDPENIANGKAPLRETNDPTSPVVFFP